MNVERFLLIFLLLICSTNLWLTDQTPQRVTQLLGEEEKMPSRTTKFTVNVLVDTVPDPDKYEKMEEEVTTTMGEPPFESENKAAWLDRHELTVKEVRQKWLDADLTPDP